MNDLPSPEPAPAAPCEQRLLAELLAEFPARIAALINDGVLTPAEAASLLLDMRRRLAAAEDTDRTAPQDTEDKPAL